MIDHVVPIAAELAAAGFPDATEVGRGGGGVVYRCHQQSLARSVAIKVLASDLDEDDRERFMREGFAMGGLSGHPNIVNILQVGVTDRNRPFIVMPYHARGSLAQRLRQAGPIAWPEALRIGVKLCGALETAHRAGTLHRDIKPANVLVNDYGDPQLSDFGTARIAGGYKTVTGFFTGTLSYTAPEVLGGSAPTEAADVYSLAATLYALIAGGPPHERKPDEDLIAHYLRITETPVPDLRPHGIPAGVCDAIEKAMSREPGGRYGTAEEFGRALQSVQQHNGLTVDAMALTEPVPAPELKPVQQNNSAEPSMFAHTASISASSLPWAVPVPAQTPAVPAARTFRKRPLVVAGAVVAVLLVALSGIYLLVPSDGTTTRAETAAPAPTAPTVTGWQPIADARLVRGGAAVTETDGTIWIFGGVAADKQVSGGQEGYDPALDSWKSGEDLPVPVDRAMAVTWRGNPVVLGGWRTDGADVKVASDQVWRMIDGHWTELPALSTPRAAATAAVVGDRIVVTGGVDAEGRLLATTEIFDGTSWKSGAPIPTPRQLVAGASDGTRVYAIGGTTGAAESDAVEAYDPATDVWTAMAPLPQARSDSGVAITDGRLVVVGGASAGTVSKDVLALDLSKKNQAGTWSELPGMAGGRRGPAVAAVGKTVYAIGGMTADGQLTASAESLELPPRRPAPAGQWRRLPDAPSERLMMAWTVLDDEIWIAGGIRHGETLQTVETYNPRTGQWRNQPPLPVGLHHATAVTYRGEVVVIGGAGDGIAAASNKVYAFRDGRWTELPPLLHPRAAPVAAVVGDKLVVLGGQNDKQLVLQTEVFDGDSWVEAPAMPTPREHLAAVSDGAYVYTLGGRSLSADENSAAMERFDPASNTWETLPDMPTARGSYGATFIDGRIVAVGGEEPTRVLATVEMYDIATRKWTALAPIAIPVHGQVVATVGNTVYCIGGADRPTHEGPVATVEALDFT